MEATSVENFASEQTDLLGSVNPKHTLVGVVDNEQEAAEARRALEQAGFPASAIATYSGQEVLENHRRFDENKSVGSKIGSLFPSQEDDIMKAYLSAAEAGAHFVTVHAEDNEARDRAAEALRSVGARLLRYYADMTIVDLSKKRDESPPQG
jgi:hypothetical protein